MFKEETIRNYIERMNTAIEHYMQDDMEGLHLAFSYGNSKIGHVLNVSLPAIHTCAHCAQCKHYCYDVRDCRYTNALNARARNYVVMRKDIVRYFSEIWAKMSRRRKNFYFRFHVGGEIPSYTYFDYMVQTAEKFPRWVIWAYTKEYAIVNEWIAINGELPSNFHVMFSEWRGLPMDNPYNMPEFRVIFKGETIPEDCTWICPGNCDICKLAGRGCLVGETTYAHEH